MGSSVSCLNPSPAPHKTKRQVMVMKDDGVMLRFKEGSQVKDVLVAHPTHQVIKCSSDRTLLPDSFHLSSNQLYFLLPKGVALHDKSMEKLLRIGASRDPTLFVVSHKRDDDDDINAPAADSNMSDDGYWNKSKKVIRSGWKPSLQTIPEVTLSELLKADASAGDQH